MRILVFASGWGLKCGALLGPQVVILSAVMASILLAPSTAWCDGPQPVKKNSVVTGDFSSFTSTTDSDCKSASGQTLALCVDVLGAGDRLIGQADQVNLSKDKISITYNALPDDQPISLRVGKKNPPDVSYPFTLEGSSGKAQLVKMREIVAGDFCQKDSNCNCTTSILIPDDPGTNHCTTKDPTFKAHDAKSAFVEDASHNQYSAMVNSIGVDKVDISFSVPSGFKPAYLGIATDTGPYRFAYAPAPPIQTTDMVFTSDKLSDVCNCVKNPANKCDTTQPPNCVSTTSTNVTLQGLSSPSATVIFKGIQDKLLVARVTAPMGLEPTAIIITNTTNVPPTSVIARRTIKPGQNNNDLVISMSVMDQETAARNYGTRTSKRYYAVNLDVRNPSAKKLQFHKSALYFDVDYVEGKGPSGWQDFYEAVEMYATFGLKNGDAYAKYWVPNPSAPNEKVLRFGLEQNVQQSPVNYLAVLGSYDETTERQNRNYQFIQLMASMAATIASGGYIANKANTAYIDATSLFSGVFLPSLKGIVINVDGINRRRVNLISQTLQDTIEVPPLSSASTVVLLPRYGILAYQGSDVPVIVDRILDVHIVAEVVTQLSEESVEKGICKLGYTKDQTRQALGEPTASSTDQSDQSGTFTYAKGPIAAVAFNAKGQLTNCTNRSAADELAAATTLAEADQILTARGLNANRIPLTDGSVVLVDIAGVDKTLHFDSSGKRAPDYTLLFAAIQGEVAATPTPSKDDFTKFLVDKATPLSKDTAKNIQDVAKKHTTDGTLDYPSPDVQGGLVEVVTKGKNIDPTSKVKFIGPQPAVIQ